MKKGFNTLDEWTEEERTASGYTRTTVWVFDDPVQLPSSDANLLDDYEERTEK